MSENKQVTGNNFFSDDVMLLLRLAVNKTRANADKFTAFDDNTLAQVLIAQGRLYFKRQEEQTKKRLGATDASSIAQAKADALRKKAGV